MKRILRQIIDTILIFLSIYSIVPIIFKDIKIESIMARVAITCALIANTYLLSEHKKVKNILLIIALFLIIIDTFIYIYIINN